MKNKSIVWMLAMTGLVGCEDSKIVEVGPEIDTTEKADTALVLRAWKSECSQHPTFLLVGKDGVVMEINQYQSGATAVYRYSEVGDTVLVAGARPDSVRIVRNLTMENKIKAFSRQK